MNNDNFKRESEGLTLRSFHLCLIATLLIACVAFLYFSHYLTTQVRNLSNAVINYENCLKSSQDLKQSSDHLTKMTWLFVETGAEQYMEDYFVELDSKRREKAIEALTEGAGEYAHLLDEARRYSTQLSMMEYHIMLLAAQGYGIPEEKLRSEVALFNMSDEERALSQSEKLTLARSLAFGEDYNIRKARIDEKIMQFTSAASGATSDEVANANQELQHVMALRRALAAIMAVMLVIFALLTYSQVTSVLQDFSAHIRQDRSFPVKGLRELRVLAKSYNEMLAKRTLREQDLIEKAEKDNLTGLFTREPFENYIEDAIAHGTADPSAFAILDVDHFKEVNDTFGHIKGDEVLRFIAGGLREALRETAIVARLGGDEFAIFFVDFGKNNSHKLPQFVSVFNKGLKEAYPKMPKLSISMGVTFYERGDNYQTLYKKADDALYRMKEAGKGGCRFSNPDELIQRPPYIKR